MNYNASFNPRDSVVPRQEVLDRLKRRTGESLIQAINRISNYQHRLYQDRSDNKVVDEELWLEELVACGRLLEPLWEDRRLELRDEDDFGSLVAQPGELITEARAGIVRRGPKHYRARHPLLYQPGEPAVLPELPRATEPN